MKKLRLDLDAIQVTTFQAAEKGSARGTVAGHLATPACPLTMDDTCWCTERLTCWCSEDVCV
jgi:hypothetical protein